MATVYLAQDLKHDREVALKALKPELATVLGAERFVLEIKASAALQHPHILPLFDGGAADGFLYYVMPFVDGETLRATLNRETQLGVENAVKLATATVTPRWRTCVRRSTTGPLRPGRARRSGSRATPK
jgi:serine/threonine-protein kinase